jgi:glycosyltransferase involved in cell wall biosynthesis
MSGIDVSVITPTFRREKQVVEAVRSALGQSNVSVEVIVLDDSENASARAAVASLGDERVRYFAREQPSRGRPAIVRNEGARLARGRYLHFLDDDDKLFDGALDALASGLDHHPRAGVAIGLVVPFGENTDVREEQRAYFQRAARTLRRARRRTRLTASLLFGATPLVNSACMVRRELALALGGYDSTIPVCEDAEFYLRAVRASGHVFVDRPVLHYRTGSPSLMSSLTSHEKLRESYGIIYRKYKLEHGFLEFYGLKVLARLF